MDETQEHISENGETTEETCRNGYSKEQHSIDKPPPAENPKFFARIIGVVGDSYCGVRYGNSVYAENTHPHKSIAIYYRTVFDHGTPQDTKVDVEPRSRVHIGCSQWTPDFGHVQYFVRTLTGAKFI